MSLFDETKKEMQNKEKKIGYEIDSGIIDLVVALNCLGIRTDSSCEGHLDGRSIFFPWVIITEDDANVDYKDNIKIEEFHNINLEKRHKLIKLISDFYKNRSTPTEHRLITGIIPGCGTELMPMSGYSSSIIKDDKEKKDIYNIYRKEIIDFTIFLINILEEK